MKALRWYGRRDLRYEDVPEPSPGPGQVKAQINLVGICGTDLKEYATGPCMIPADKVPVTMGHEFAGRVVAMGEGVTGFNVGDRVTGLGYWCCGRCYYCKRGLYNLCLNSDFTGLTKDGSMAEYFVAPDYSFYKLPDSVSDELGTLVEPLAVSLHAVRQGNVRPGDTVAIVGDGTIGLCCLLAARVAGATAVYVVAKHKGRGEMALAMGATAVIYLGDGEPISQIGGFTDGLGADVTIECVGQPDTPQLAVQLARKGGTVVILGVFEKPGSFDFSTMMFSERILVGSSIYVDEARTAIALLADGRIDPGCLITATVLFKDAVNVGFERLLTGKEENIKVLLEVA
jgi:(R,R)-butanediol dehydrogenase/meso-butanediol dehydrogenase/diacetyl reductase